MNSWSQNEHLVPVDSSTNAIKDLRDYYKNAFVLLYKGFTEMPVIQYAVFPSFGKNLQSLKKRIIFV